VKLVTGPSLALALLQRLVALLAVLGSCRWAAQPSMSALFHRCTRILVVPIALLTCAPLQASEAKWNHVSSDHFFLLTDAGTKKGQEILARFEQMRSVFAQLLGRSKVRLSQPIEIIAVQSPAMYAQLVPPGTSLPGVFLRGEERVFVVLNCSVEGSWRAVEHPFAHYLLDYNYPPTASWFDEGFAEYFASLYFTPKKTELGSDPELPWPGQPAYSEQGSGLKSLTEILNSPVWLNITDLLEMRNRVVDGREGTHHTLFYAQSWMLMHYLLDQKKLSQTGTYFDLVENQRVPITQALQQAFGVTPADLDQQVKDYFHSLKALQASLREAQTPGAPLTPEPVNEGPLPFLVNEVATSAREVLPQETDALLAEEMLRVPVHRQDAVQQLNKLADDPKTETAVAHRALSWAYVQQGDSKKAFEELHAALNLNGSDPWSHFGVALAAYHSAQKGKYIQGLANTMESLQFVLDEFREFAEGYNILGWARLSGGGGNGAVEAMRMAVQLSPRNGSYQLRLARAYLAAKKFDEATGTLDRLQHSHDPQIARAAAKDLEDLPFLKKYGVSPEEQQARQQQASAIQKEVEESEPDEGDDATKKAATAAPVIDKRPVKFLKGKLVSVDCSQPPAAVLSVSEGRGTVKLRVRDFNSMTLMGAGKFSCEWKNLPVSVNYREESKLSGDLVSLQVE
jgi:tetratricopeptide (TPR) repeat protein